MSLSLVRSAIKRSYRLANGLYGSAYQPHYSCPTTSKEVIALLEGSLLSTRENPRPYAQDIESMYFKGAGQKALDVWHPEFRVWCVGFSFDPYHAFCIPFDPDPFLVQKFGLTSIYQCPRILELTQELAAQNAIHHSTIDARGLAKYGVLFTDLDDSMLVNIAIDDTARGGNGVDDLAEVYTEEGGYKDREWRDNVPETLQDVNWSRLAHYCCHDSDIERRLFFHLKEMAIADGVWDYYEKISKPSNMTGIRMTLNGAAMDKEHILKLIDSERAKQQPLVEELYKRPEMGHCLENIKRLAATRKLEGKSTDKYDEVQTIRDITMSQTWAMEILFFDVCKFPVGDLTGKGQRKIDAEHLEKVADKQPTHKRIVELVLEIKRIDKKLSTYLVPYLEPKLDKTDEEKSAEERAALIARGKVERFQYLKWDGCVHSLFIIGGAITGRIASASPNFQNILNDIAVKMSFIGRLWKVGLKEAAKPLMGEVQQLVRGLVRGMLTAGDFAQHEVRMCAWLCRDENMIANLEKGFHMINLALLEKLITPGEVGSITKERVDALENTVWLRYLRKVDEKGVLKQMYGETIYSDYSYQEVLSVLGAEVDAEGKKLHKGLLGEWKNYFKVRKTVAKESTFGPLYGMTEKSFSAIHEIPLIEAQQMFETDRKTYPKKHAYFAEVKARARRDGFVQSQFGKKRRLDYKTALARSDDSAVAELDRFAVNTLVQGTSSEVGVLCMHECMRRYDEIGLPALGIGTIHDSLMNDVHPDYWQEQLGIQHEVMENYPTQLLGSDHVGFKAELEYGLSWGEMQPWEPKVA